MFSQHGNQVLGNRICFRVWKTFLSGSPDFPMEKIPFIPSSSILCVRDSVSSVTPCENSWISLLRYSSFECSSIRLFDCSRVAAFPAAYLNPRFSLSAIHRFFLGEPALRPVNYALPCVTLLLVTICCHIPSVKVGIEYFQRNPGARNFSRIRPKFERQDKIKSIIWFS